ncbi:hypothetical protein [Micromonospora maris]|uniref:hypothetical protein n=1 Tax=Micromonospora maris TaxID=1003110 RepID=UPI002E14A5CE|nr:hypothetical protein OG712_19720 [Micromonospora maris]
MTMSRGYAAPPPAIGWFAAALAAVALTACSGSHATGTEPTSSHSPRASTSLTSPLPAASPTPPIDRDGDGLPDGTDPYPDDPTNTPRQEPVMVTCYLDDDFDQNQTFIVTGDQRGRPDFTEAWKSKPVACEVDSVVQPITKPERAAYKTSRYDDQDVSVLYAMCAEVDQDDVYARSGFSASKSQIAEINAALTLCPQHPYARKWRDSARRGQRDVELEAQGRLFGPGTFRVGKEIKPGTYVTTDVDGCYWERQNSSGNIIDNYFTNSARRVQVTIRSSDYAFSSQRCGEWRPVS